MNSIHQLTEEELVSRLHSGDQSVISILYDNYASVLYGVILRIVKQEQTSQDLMQDCFRKIWFNRLSYDPVKERLLHWLIYITRSIAIETVRSPDYVNATRFFNKEEENFKSNGGNYVFSTNCIGLNQLAQVLGPEEKQVFDLFLFSNFTPEEAAEKLNIPITTVKTSAINVITKLKNFFIQPVGKSD